MNSSDEKSESENFSDFNAFDQDFKQASSGMLFNLDDLEQASGGVEQISGGMEHADSMTLVDFKGLLLQLLSMKSKDTLRVLLSAELQRSRDLNRVKGCWPLPKEFHPKNQPPLVDVLEDEISIIVNNVLNTDLVVNTAESASKIKDLLLNIVPELQDLHQNSKIEADGVFTSLLNIGIYPQ